MKKLSFLIIAVLSSIVQVALSEEKKDNNLPTYLVSTEFNYAPFIYLDELGKVSGFDVDIMNAIAKDQGFNVQYLPTTWDEIFDKVASGATDIIADGIIGSEKRREKFELSNPYIISHRVAIISNPKFAHFDNIEQLGGLRYATQAGSTNVGYLKTLFGEDANILGISTQFEEMKALLTGQVDVAYDDYYVMLPYLKREKYKKKVVKVIPDNKVGTNLPFVFVVKKGRLDLLSKINTGLANIKNNGTFQKIYDQYFSLDD